MLNDENANCPRNLSPVRCLKSSTVITLLDIKVMASFVAQGNKFQIKWRYCSWYWQFDVIASKIQRRLDFPVLISVYDNNQQPLDPLATTLDLRNHQLVDAQEVEHHPARSYLPTKVGKEKGNRTRTVEHQEGGTKGKRTTSKRYHSQCMVHIHSSIPSSRTFDSELLSVDQGKQLFQSWKTEASGGRFARSTDLKFHFNFRRWQLQFFDSQIGLPPPKSYAD